MSVETRRIERLAPLVAGLGFATPVLVAKFPPMDDLPLHEATIGLFRHWSDPHFTPHSLYFINLGHSNQLFSLIVLALSYVFPLAWAAKIGVAATLVALPLAAARFADHVRAPRWTALLVAPIGFGWLFFWGLVQNILGITVFLALLPTIDRFAFRPTARGVLKMCAAMVLLHFAHQIAQVLACGALVACSIGAPQNRRNILLRAIPLVFSAALAFAANRYAWHFANHAQVSSVAAVYTPIPYKFFEISGVLFGGFEPYVRNSMLLLGLAPVIVFFLERVRLSRGDGARFAARIHRYRFEIMVLALLVLYFVAPVRIKVTTLVYHRFLPPAWAILAISAGAGTRETCKAFPRLLCLALPVASLLVAWPTFADSDRIYSDLESIMKSMEPGSSVLSASFGRSQGSRMWNPAIIAGHVVAEHGGRSVNDYTMSPISILSQRPEKQWVEPHARLRKRHFDLRPAWDLTRFRYLIIESDSPQLAMTIARALKGQARLVAWKGDLYLYESTLPLVPIDADDAPLPQPPPPSLDALVRTSMSDRRAAVDTRGPETPQ